MENIIANIFINKIRVNFPKPFRPLVQELLYAAKTCMMQKDWVPFLKAMTVGEPTDIISIDNVYIIKSIFKISMIYRNDFFYVLAKIKEYTTENNFVRFAKLLYEMDLKF